MKNFICFLCVYPLLICWVSAQAVDLLIGTYTKGGKSRGIHVYAFDTGSGHATKRNEISVENPSFLIFSANRKYVYAVNEVGDGKGGVSAFAYDPTTGSLTLLNRRTTGGDSPCHVAMDRGGRYLFVSNYAGGSLSVFPIEPDGSIGGLLQFIPYQGNGPDERRQRGPHIHSAFFGPDERQLYVQDLGTDRIYIYDFHPDSGNVPLVPSATPYVMGTPGGGPRHVAWSADGRFLYVIQEMAATVKVYATSDEGLVPVQEVSVNEDGFEGRNGAADVKLSVDGRFLYATNRGEANILVVYSVSETDGRLARLAVQPVSGRGPRSFAISPDGKYLLVANQQTDEVVVFSRDGETGLVEETGYRITVGTPVCVLFD